MSSPIHVLLIEDSEDDALLLLRELRRAYEPVVERVETAASMQAALAHKSFDLILSDFRLPRFSALEALKLFHNSGLDIPFIIISGTIGEETAVTLMKAGAHDYLMKGNLTRLLPAIERELKEAAGRRERYQNELARLQLNQKYQLLNTAIEQMAEGMIITDVAEVIQYVNPAFEQITGYSRDEVIGLSIAAILRSGQHDPAFFQEMNQMLRQGQVWRGRLIDRKKDGTLFTSEAVITPARDEQGQIVSYVTVHRDVTRELELEEQYYQAQKMDAIGQLTAGIAHDFNNLLLAINGFTELVQSRLSPTDPNRKMMDRVLSAGQKAADLIRQLMAFSRKQIIEPRMVDLNQIVSQMDSLLQRIIGEHIVLNTVLSPLPCRVKVDQAQFEQVIVNLVVNARDAMPDGGALQIETTIVSAAEAGLSKSPDEEGFGFIRFTVSDTGTGIAPELQSHIFEPFFTTKETGKGTGLGLATVYGIIKQNNGDIRLESEVGKGTTFYIYLPAAETEDDRIMQARPQPETAGGHETILLVEDEQAIRDLIITLLQNQGYTLLAAADGQAALKLAAQHEAPIHLLMTDVVMPGLSGKAVSEQLIRNHPSLKILYMSGYTDDIIAHHGVLDPNINFLEKPFSTEILIRKVRAVLDAS